MNIYRKDQIPTHLTDYFEPAEIGLEGTPDAYIARMVEVFREVRRVLADDGTLWLNIGDTYATNHSSDNRTPEQRAKSSTLGPKRDGLGGNNAGHVSVSFGGRPRGHGSCKQKDRLGIPHMLAFALRADGWYWRDEIVWHKPNPMPESVTDRCTKAHEFVFLLSKSARYFYDAEAVAEPSKELPGEAKLTGQHKQLALGQNATGTLGRNYGQPRKRGGGASFGKQNHDATGTGQQSRTYDRPVYLTRNRRSVWTIPTESYHGAHFAVIPAELVRPCVLAGSRPGDVVLDPFSGSGTVLAVAAEHGRQGIGCDLNPAYVALAEERLATVTPDMFSEAV